jgi:putative flippase GtrA
MKTIINLYKKYEEIVVYLFVGVFTTIINFAMYYLLVYTILNPNNPIELQVANIVSWICAVSFAYVANRKAVFKSNEKNIKKEVVKFFGARVVTLVFDMLFMFITVSVFKINDKIMKILSNVFVTILNYVLSKIFVFKKKD